MLTPQLSQACDCTYAGNFAKFSQGQTVIRGKIENYGPQLSHGETLHETMTVYVIDLVKGSYPNESVVFLGDPGHLCLTYVDSDIYPIGSEHLFILFSDNKKQGLAGCGEVSVGISKGRVKGTKYIDKKQVDYSTEYDSFISSIKK